jgi:hypothetical protein
MLACSCILCSDQNFMQEPMWGMCVLCGVTWYYACGSGNICVLIRYLLLLLFFCCCSSSENLGGLVYSR